MLVPYVDFRLWIPLTVFIASLLGSGHCVAMCGPLTIASIKTQAQWVSYHVGRLIGYLTLGALAGGIGAQLLWWQGYASWTAASLLGLLFVMSGIRVWRGKGIHFSFVPQALLFWLHQKVGSRSFLVGLLTVFLPCGWLHSFVLGAVATQSVVSGTAFLFAFWLGTLPALGFAPWLVSRFFEPALVRSPRIVGLILISAGLLSVGIKVAPLLSGAAQEEQKSCH